MNVWCILNVSKSPTYCTYGETDTLTHTSILRLSGFSPGQPGWAPRSAGTKRNIHPLLQKIHPVGAPTCRHKQGGGETQLECSTTPCSGAGLCKWWPKGLMDCGKAGDFGSVPGMLTHWQVEQVKSGFFNHTVVIGLLAAWNSTGSYNNHLMPFCQRLPRWAGTRSDIHPVMWGCLQGRITEADAPTVRLDATQFGLSLPPTPSTPPFLRRLPFLLQLFQFILAWDRHQVCLVAYPHWELGDW